MTEASQKLILAARRKGDEKRKKCIFSFHPFFKLQAKFLLSGQTKFLNGLCSITITRKMQDFHSEHTNGISATLMMGLLVCFPNCDAVPIN